MPAPVITIDATGIHVPTYEDVLLYVTDTMRTIYGVDLYLEPDSQDGQFIGILAEGINSAFQSAQALFSAYSPATAQGTGLSNAVKINGLARRVPSRSIVDLLIGGDVGTLIENGIATDSANTRWLMPASVTIPGGGTIMVQAVAEEAGATQAPANTITIIATPTRGWFTVNNPLAASPGIPVETDAQLRLRQSVSTALPSVALLDGLLGNLLGLEDVTFARVYENDTDVTDANGLLPYSIAAVVEGGLDADIAEAIRVKKTPGAYLNGTTSFVVTNPVSGLTSTMRWYRPAFVAIKVEVTVAQLPGYSSVIGDAIKASLAEYITGLEVGDDVYWSRLFPPATLPLPDGGTYSITLLRLARLANAFGTANLAMTFTEKAALLTTNVTIIVV